MILGPGVRVQRGMRVRFEQHGEVALARHEVVELRRQQRAGGVGGAVDGPRRAGPYQQPIAVGVGLRVGRYLDAGQLALDALVQVAVIEIPGDGNEVALIARRAVVVRADREVARLALVHRAGRRQRRAALPFLGDARVARFGHRAGAEVGTDVEGVLVDPADLAFRYRQREAALHERLVRNAELAHHGRIAAVRRQRNQAAFVRRLQAFHVLEHPARVLGLVQRVDVQQHLPRRLGLAVFGQRGAPPDAARVRLVAPEVVQVVAHAVDVGDACFGVEHFENAVAGACELGVVDELFRGSRVLLLHPVQRAGAVDVFQPQERIVAGWSVRGRGLGGGIAGMGVVHARQCDAECQHQPDRFHRVPPCASERNGPDGRGPWSIERNRPGMRPPVTKVRSAGRKQESRHAGGIPVVADAWLTAAESAAAPRC